MCSSRNNSCVVLSCNFLFSSRGRSSHMFWLSVNCSKEEVCCKASIDNIRSRTARLPACLWNPERWRWQLVFLQELLRVESTHTAEIVLHWSYLKSMANQQQTHADFAVGWSLISCLLYWNREKSAVQICNITDTLQIFPITCGFQAQLKGSTACRNGVIPQQFLFNYIIYFIGGAGQKHDFSHDVEYLSLHAFVPWSHAIAMNTQNASCWGGAGVAIAAG